MEIAPKTQDGAKEPKAPKKERQEAQKVTPEASREMAYSVKNFLKGEVNFKHLRDANGRQNGPNSIDLGNGVTLTRSIE